MCFIYEVSFYRVTGVMNDMVLLKKDIEISKVWDLSGTGLKDIRIWHWGYWSIKWSGIELQFVEYQGSKSQLLSVLKNLVWRDIGEHRGAFYAADSREPNNRPAHCYTSSLMVNQATAKWGILFAVLMLWQLTAIVQAAKIWRLANSLVPSLPDLFFIGHWSCW